jgi:serine/threonine protein kinase
MVAEGALSRSAVEIAGYRIDAVIGHGGMATVYRAEQLRLGRDVALKVLAPELAADHGFRARFLAESRTTAQLEHPHIVPVFDAGESDGILYIAMRLVPGFDLSAVLARHGALPPLAVATIAVQLAQARAWRRQAGERPRGRVG